MDRAHRARCMGKSDVHRAHARGPTCPVAAAAAASVTLLSDEQGIMPEKRVGGGMAKPKFSKEETMQMLHDFIDHFGQLDRIAAALERIADAQKDR